MILLNYFSDYAVLAVKPVLFHICIITLHIIVFITHMQHTQQVSTNTQLAGAVNAELKKEIVHINYLQLH